MLWHPPGTQGPASEVSACWVLALARQRAQAGAAYARPSATGTGEGVVTLAGTIDTRHEVRKLCTADTALMLAQTHLRVCTGGSQGREHG
jgi:hypothetical protein